MSKLNISLLIIWKCKIRKIRETEKKTKRKNICRKKNK